MKVLSTPDERFDHLPGFDFALRYLDAAVGADGRLPVVSPLSNKNKL